MKFVLRSACFLLLLLIPLRAECDPGTALALRGHAEYQIQRTHFRSRDFQALEGTDRVTTNSVDLRLVSELDMKPVRLSLEGEFLGQVTDAVQAFSNGTRQAGAISGVPLLDDERRLFDLTADIPRGEEVQGVLRIDRAYIDWTNADTVVRLGRQSISWGGGLAFNVLDLFNPFTPLEIDKDYKTGEDMLYAQLLFSNGDDIQFLAIGRRDENRSIRVDESSFALKWHRYYREMDFDLILAQHFDEPQLGFAVSLPLLEGILRFDTLVTDPEDEGLRTSYILNYDRTWTFLGKPLYGFVEYYRNGFGVAEDAYVRGTPAASARRERGEIFVLSKDYLAFGGQLELTPLLSGFVTCLGNLGDESGVVQVRFNYSLAQDAEVLIGVNTPYGARGSEFGGIEISPETYVAFNWDMYLRLSYYF